MSPLPVQPQHSVARALNLCSLANYPLSLSVGRRRIDNVIDTVLRISPPTFPNPPVPDSSSSAASKVPNVGHPKERSPRPSVVWYATRRATHGLGPSASLAADLFADLFADLSAAGKPPTSRRPDRPAFRPVIATPPNSLCWVPRPLPSVPCIS